MSEKITIKSCVLKKSNENYKLYDVETTDGRKGRSFDEFKPGDTVEVDIKNDEKYGLTFFKVKEMKKNGFPTKDYIFEKRKAALECAVSLAGKSEKALKSDEVVKVAEKFYEFLNPQSK